THDFGDGTNHDEQKGRNPRRPTSRAGRWMGRVDADDLLEPLLCTYTTVAVGLGSARVDNNENQGVTADRDEWQRIVVLNETNS
ncbi:unnamed protein product, partial [Citrullus colocynthis]